MAVRNSASNSFLKCRPYEKWEDQIIRGKYPDYKAIGAALPHRTYWALRARAKALGIIKHKVRWSPALRIALREGGFEKFTDQEIAEFMGCSEGAAEQVRQSMGIFRAKPVAATPRSPLVLDIRQRARDLGVPLHHLLRRAKCSSSALHKATQYSPAARMVRILGGELFAEWED